jgi:hypothetical protein
MHNDQRSITTSVLQDAADAAGTDIETVVQNIAKTMALVSSVQKRADSQPPAAEYAACRVLKTAAEQRYTLGLAYPAMRLDAGVAADGHIDFASPQALEQTAWNWMSKQRTISLFHTPGTGTDGHATAVESYLWPSDEPWVIKGLDGTVQRICKGDWLLGTVWDEHGWALVKAGLVNGWSPEGAAKRSRPSAQRLAQLRA